MDEIDATLATLEAMDKGQQRVLMTEILRRDRSVYDKLTERLDQRELANAATQDVVNQGELEERFGGYVNTTKPLGSVTMHTRMGVRETVPERVGVANRSGELPEGYKAVGVEDDSGNIEMAYTKPGDDAFYLMNEPGAFDNADAGEIVGAVANVENALALVGEGLGTKFAGKLPRFTRWTANMLGAAIGASAGRGIDETLEGMTDGELQDYESYLGEMSESGALGAAGAGIGKILERVINVRQGRGLLPASERSDNVRAVQEAAREEGYPALSLGETGNQTLRRQENIAAGVSSTVRDAQTAKLEAPARRLLAETHGVEDVGSLSDDALEEVFKEEAAKAKDLLSRRLLGKGFPAEEATKEKGGKAVKATIDLYDEASREYTGRLMDDVLAAAADDGISFNLVPLREWAEKEAREFSLPGRKTTEEVPSSIVDANGRPLGTTTVESEEAVRFTRNHEAKLEKVVSLLTRIGDTAGPQHFEALRELRTLLGDLSRPDPGALNRSYSQGAASSGYGVLSDIIKKDAGGSAALREAQQIFDSAWQQRIKTLEGFDFVSMADQIGGGQLIFERLVGGGSVTLAHADFLLKQMPVERRREFQSALITELRDHPNMIPDVMDKMGDTFDTFIPPDVQTMLKRYRRDMSQVSEGLLMSVYKKQADDAMRVNELVERGGVQELKQLIDDGKMTAERVRTAIFHDIVDSTTEFVEGSLRIKPKAFEAQVKRLKADGLWDLLSGSQRRMLSRTGLYTSFLREAGDSGSSIASAAISAKVADLGDPVGAARALIHAVQVSNIARMSNSEKAANIIAGLGEAPKGMPAIRGGVTISALAAREYMQDARAAEEQN